MKMLLDQNNVIQEIGNYSFVINDITEEEGSGGVKVYAGESIAYVMPEYNSSNARAIEVPEDTEIPEDFHPSNKYKWENGSFVKNPFYSDPYLTDIEAINLLNSLSTNIPLKEDLDAVENKIDKIVSQWKNIINHGCIDNIDERLTEGIFIYTKKDKDLTANQKKSKKYVLNMLAKLKARYRIESEIGDVYDQIADIEKKLNFFSGLTARLYMELFEQNGFHGESKQQYDTIIKTWMQKINDGEFRDTADIHPLADLFSKLIVKDVKKASIVEEYLSNKK